LLVQIYEVATPEEARAVARIGVDHVGVLVGAGEFPRELPVAAAQRVAAAIPPGAKFCALFLAADLALIAAWAEALRPDILHLGAAPELLSPAQTALVRGRLPGIAIMRSVPVVEQDSVAIARSYTGIADFLLLDSYRADDRQIGALGVTHDWTISRRIVAAVPMPVILAGGLGPDNVADAIRAVCPHGVDSKTRTDRDGSHEKGLARVRRFCAAARRATPPAASGRQHR
jgi:phosphoribosylanthranilate isomerase